MQPRVLLSRCDTMATPSDIGLPPPQVTTIKQEQVLGFYVEERGAPMEQPGLETSVSTGTL